MENIKTIYIEKDKYHKPVISLPENICLKDFCKNPIYEKKHYDKLITYKSLIEKIKLNESIKKLY